MSWVLGKFDSISMNEQVHRLPLSDLQDHPKPKIKLCISNTRGWIATTYSHGSLLGTPFSMKSLSLSHTVAFKHMSVVLEIWNQVNLREDLNLRMESSHSTQGQYRPLSDPSRLDDHLPSAGLVIGLTDA